MDQESDEEFYEKDEEPPKKEEANKTGKEGDRRAGEETKQVNRRIHIIKGGGSSTL